MDVVVWLRGLGLGKYEATFREDEIDETVLPSLARENLKELSFCPVLSVTTKQASNSSTD
jgi:SAM domain (Sterile alpha motif)